MKTGSDFSTEVLLKAGSTTFHGNQYVDVASQGEAPRQADPNRNQVPANRNQTPVAGEKPTTGGKKGGEAKPTSGEKEKPQKDEDKAVHQTHKPGDTQRMVDNILRQLKSGKEAQMSRATFPRFLSGLAQRGGKAPIDIVNIRLLGTFLIGHGGQGIARKKMPQVDSDQRETFLKWLGDKHGVGFTKKEVDPESLLPIQKEINGRKVAGIMTNYLKKGGYPDSERIMVTKDGYVLDGHHNWCASLALHILDPSMKLPVYEINDTWKGAMEKALAWDKENGIEGQDMSATKPVKKWLTEALVSLYFQKGGQGSGRYRHITDLELIKAERGATSDRAVLHQALYRQRGDKVVPVLLHVEPHLDPKQLAREFGNRRLQGARLISLQRA